MVAEVGVEVDIQSEVVAAATTRAALLVRAQHISHRAAMAALIIQPDTPRTHQPGTPRTRP
jgi:hypothetical protein